MPLSYEQTQKAMNAALAKAAEMSISVSVAVVDGNGFPAALVRMSGARAFTGDVAIGKAKTSALFGNASGRVAQNMPGAIFQAVNDATGGRAVAWQGAVPIKAGDDTIGAIGVSGSTSENDEIVAQAGADAV